VPKQKYSIDLAGQQAECEANYLRIMKLLPDMEGGAPVEMRIEVTERCKYTTMLEISQLKATCQWSSAPCFALRVYHDAKMAEVIAFDRHHRLLPYYEYPNKDMYQSDEKAQLNLYLGEWLSHCLLYGHETDSSAGIDLCRIAGK